MHIIVELSQLISKQFLKKYHQHNYVRLPRQH